MGIDPGTATTGWGVIEKGSSGLMCVEAGVITTPPKTSPSSRLLTIFADVTELLTQFKPHAVALEQLFFNTNVTTAMTVGQARGVVMLAVEKKGLPLFSYTPLQVKMAITGFGRAEKKQVQTMVQKLLKLKTLPKPDDAADGLAIALTHSYSFKLKK